MTQESVKSVTQATFWINQHARIVLPLIILKTAYNVAGPTLSAQGAPNSFTCTRDNVNRVIMKPKDASNAKMDCALNANKATVLTRQRMNVKNVALLSQDASSALIQRVPNVFPQNLSKTLQAKGARAIKSRAGQKLRTLAYANLKSHSPAKTMNKIASIVKSSFLIARYVYDKI